MDRTTPRHFNIPTFHLTKILRNSADIIPLIQDLRAGTVAEYPHLRAASSDNETAGHNITCTPVVYHTISENTDDDDDDDDEYSRAFVIQMLDEVLPQVARMVEGRSPSDVAILYDNLRIDVSALENLVENLVKKNFKCNTQTIKDLELLKNKDCLIFDEWDNSPSFEFEVVVAVSVSLYPLERIPFTCHDVILHNMITRARSHLVVVDPLGKYEYLKYPTSIPTMHFWERDEKTGKFVKCVDKSAP